MVLLVQVQRINEYRAIAGASSYVRPPCEMIADA
jgi:hypothetical protein